MKLQTVLLALLLYLLTGGGVMAQNNQPLRQHFGYTPSPENMKRIHRAHLSGLHRDTSMVPMVLEMVNQPQDHAEFFTAVHALARLGVPQALPAIEAAMQRLSHDKEPHDYAEVAHARLIAEGRVHSLTPSQAREKLRTFLSTLHFDGASSLNAMVVQEDEYQRSRFTREDGSRAQYALRELADMIYHKRDSALAEACKEAGIDFNTDAGAKYKVQLAPLTSEQRVDWIISHLTDSSALKADYLYLVQLAADEGKITGHKVASRLKEMDKHREKYGQHGDPKYGRVYFPGYTAMFRVLGVVGEAEFAPVLEHYLHDKEADIQYYAQESYGIVKAGLPWKLRIGY